MTILDLVRQDGIELKRVAGTHGGEYAGPCPLCGGQDRFRAWPEEGEGGSYWCRGCDKGGDCIQYLRDVRKMSFQDACSFLSRDPNKTKPSSDSNKTDKSQWKPKESNSPEELWRKKSSVLVDWCHKQLFSAAGKDVLEYLKTERGLSEETIKAFRLGFNPKAEYRKRGAWGLPEEKNKQGKPKKIYIPAGVVIPCFFDGLLQRVKIRLQDPRENESPYLPIPGGYSGSWILGDNHKIFIVVESELCGILLNQEIGDLAGIVALGSAYIRPGKEMSDVLQNAELLLVALDKDNPGAKQAWNFWLKNFINARRWPPIDGKDPSEMWKAGVDLREWAQVGIDEYCKPSQELQPPVSVESIIKPISYDIGETDFQSLNPDFSEANISIKIHSELIGEDFYLVSDPNIRDQVKGEDPEAVVYLPEEIEFMRGLNPEEIKKCFEAKKEFGGQFVARNKLADNIFERAIS